MSTGDEMAGAQVLGRDPFGACWCRVGELHGGALELRWRSREKHPSRGSEAEEAMYVLWPELWSSEAMMRVATWCQRAGGRAEEIP